MKLPQAAAIGLLCSFMIVGTVVFGEEEANEKAAKPEDAGQVPGAPKAEEGLGASKVEEASQEPFLPVEMHKYEMRLSGSSCLACIKDLEKQLLAVSGVMKCKIEYPGGNVYQAVPGAGWSLATIMMDVNKVTTQHLMEIMKAKGFHAFKVIDKGPL